MPDDEEPRPDPPVEVLDESFEPLVLEVGLLVDVVLGVLVAVLVEVPVELPVDAPSSPVVEVECEPLDASALAATIPV